MWAEGNVGGLGELVVLFATCWAVLGRFWIRSCWLDLSLILLS